ncbi:MAG: OB-fold nucleic acid binding domain-containing protein [Paludibacteraceae bacterium]|nr:OB-fold nucleic acid binding domain-containing protein [Paludibacteraceae bacterium]
MKRLFTTLLIAMVATTMMAQIQIWYNGAIEYQRDYNMIDSITFSLTDIVPPTHADTNGIEIPIDSALKICKNLEVNAKTAEMYKLSGVVSKNITNPVNVPGLYTNINFDLSDGTGSITCYYINNINNQPFSKNGQMPRVGSKVTVIGVLTPYQKVGTANPPMPELTDGFLVRIDSLVAPPPFPGCPEPAEGQISATDAAKQALVLGNKQASNDAYDVLGVVTEVLDFADGKATYIISSDGKQFFEIYRGYGMNNSPFPGREYIQPNDTVVVHCKLKNYYGTPETNDNAPLVSTTNPNYAK